MEGGVAGCVAGVEEGGKSGGGGQGGEEVFDYFCEGGCQLCSSSLHSSTIHPDPNPRRVKPGYDGRGVASSEDIKLTTMPIRSRHMQHSIPRLPIYSYSQHFINSAPLALAQRLEGLTEIAELARTREVDQVIGVVFGEGGRHCVCMWGIVLVLGTRKRKRKVGECYGGRFRGVASGVFLWWVWIYFLGPLIAYRDGFRGGIVRFMMGGTWKT